MSIGSILSIARTAMITHQTAMQVASQNVANAATKGYSRQRAELAASPPEVMPGVSLGMGVDIAAVTRARDALLDTSFRAQSGDAAGYGAARDALQHIEGILGEPSDAGLAASIDAFWSSWGDLAADPTSGAARSVVRQRGDQLAHTLNRFATQLDDLSQTSRERMGSDVRQANSLLSQIAELNPRIVAAESGRSDANDLRDARDRALDQLATLVGARSFERGDGSVGVYVGSRLVLDANAARQLALSNGTPPSITFADSGSTLDEAGGTIGATLAVVSTQVPDVLAKLDALAQGVVDTVNGIHTSAVLFSGTPPVASAAGNFFEVTSSAPAGGDPLKTARGIRLAATLSDGSKVAASGAGAAGPGDNAAARALAALTDTTVAFTTPTGAPTIATTSVGEFYRSIVTDVATASAAAQDSATVHETLAKNNDNQRQSVSGVSTDEELVDVIQHQHAYAAAARMVSVVDEMLQTLVGLGR
jgi:flagellar hook-associated protein 1 FlgK